MTINRCICFNTKFEDLKKILDESKLKTIAELQEKEDFGFACGMCIPYIVKMIKTGETSFKP